MGKCSVLVWYNGKSQRAIDHAPGCTLQLTPINQGQYGLSKFHRMLTGFFKDPDRIHACAEVATPQQKEIWKHQPTGAVVSYTEDSKSEETDIFMHPLIHLEESNDEEDGHGNSLSKPMSLESTQEPVCPNKKSTKEPTLAPDPGTSPEPSMPTREDNKGHLTP